MRKMSLEETQGCCLELFKEFDRLCTNGGYQYWLIGGSALGAVRNKGIIPWDDDIDVGMPRKDYESFCKAFVIHDHYELLTLEEGHGFFNPFAKLCNTNTLFEEPTSANCPHGVSIDIFPIDYISGSDAEIRKALNRKRLYNHTFVVNLNADSLKAENIAKRAARRLMKMSYAGRDPVELAHEITASIATDEPTPRMMNIWGSWEKREIMKSEWFGAGARVPFEDTTCPIPSNWDQYLTTLYGDYMTPPATPPRYHGSAFWLDGAPKGN